jgi:hypothetical protein
MGHPNPGPSKEPRTYTARDNIVGLKLTCSRCGRTYPFPEPGSPPIRCECGWWYENVGGLIQEAFRPRL